MHPLEIFYVRAFLKHLPKNILVILTICDDVSILQVRHTK